MTKELLGYMTRHYKLGLSDKTWTYIGLASAGLLLVTTSKSAANSIGKNGIFGYGKSKKLASLGKGQETTWGSLQNISLLLIAITMVENNYDSISKVVETRQYEKFQDIF